MSESTAFALIIVSIIFGIIAIIASASLVGTGNTDLIGLIAVIATVAAGGMMSVSGKTNRR